MSKLRRTIVDLGVAATLPFIAIWIYELSNLVVLTAAGCTVSLTVAGGLPAGVAGVSTAATPLFTKAVQVAISIGLLLPLAVFFAKKRFFLARVSVVTSAAVFLASAYWEFLSSLSVLSLAAHTEIFVAGTGALSFVLLWEFGRPRPRIRGTSIEILP